MTNSTIADQRNSALQKATAKRQAIKSLRLKLEGGHLTLGDVLLPEPASTVVGLSVIDVIRWVPYYGTKATKRWLRLGDMAIKADVNLFQNTEVMPRWARAWVVDVVTNPTRAPRTPERMLEQSDDADVKRLAHTLAYTQRRLQSAEEARNAALSALHARDKLLAGQQFAMPTVEAERMLAELADAVEEHWRDVKAGKWDGVDERLRERKDAILSTGSVPVLRAVA
jgi:hypothetical protein